MSRFVAYILKIRFAVILIAVAVFSIAALSYRDFSYSFDMRVFFADDNPYLLELEAFEKTYTPNQNVLFVVHFDERSVFDARSLKVIEELTEAAWSLPHATRVDSLTNFPHVYGSADDIAVEALTQAFDPSDPADLLALQDVALHDPSLVDRLISPNGLTTGVNVNFLLPKSASAEVLEINAAVRDLIQRFETQHPGTHILYTGNVVLMRTFGEAALRDVVILMPLSALVIFGLLLFLLRSLRATLGVMCTLGFVAGTAIAIPISLGHPINTATVVAPVIIMTLAMASAIHILIRIRRRLAQGDDHNTAILASCQANATPIALMSLTTSIGFLAMNFSDAPPFRDLGNVVVAGIAINLIATFTLLPALLSFATPKPLSARTSNLARTMAQFLKRHSLTLAILGPLGAGLMATGLARVELDDDFIHYFDESFDYRKGSDYAQKHLTGLNIVEFSLPAGGDGQVYHPEYQRRLEQFTTWLDDQPRVIKTLSIVDTTKRLHNAFNGSAGMQSEIPDEQNLIAQYFLLYELSLPYGLDLTDQINVARSESRVTVLLQNATSGDIRRLNQQAQTWLQGNTPAHMHVRGTSINVVFAYLSTINIKSMVKGTAISFLIISLIIALSLRSVSLGLVSIVTNTVPAIAAFGLWGYFTGEINLAASVITAMTIGIVVDDTIHFLHSYQKQRMSGASVNVAIKYVYETVGSAMLITTIALSGGFIVLAASGSVVNRTLGIFAAVIVIIALLVDLFILPALLYRFDRRKAYRSTQGQSTSTIPPIMENS